MPERPNDGLFRLIAANVTATAFAVTQGWSAVNGDSFATSGRFKVGGSQRGGLITPIAVVTAVDKKAKYRAYQQQPINGVSTLANTIVGFRRRLLAFGDLTFKAGPQITFLGDGKSYATVHTATMTVAATGASVTVPEGVGAELDSIYSGGNATPDKISPGSALSVEDGDLIFPDSFDGMDLIIELIRDESGGAGTGVSEINALYSNSR